MIHPRLEDRFATAAQAKNSLLDLRKYNEEHSLKPYGSKVLLVRTPSQLSMELPYARGSSVVDSLLTPKSWFILVFVLPVVKVFPYLVFVLVPLLVAFIVWKAIKQSTRPLPIYQLELDKYCMSVKKGALIWNRITVSKAMITRVSYEPSYAFSSYYDKSGKQMTGRVKTEPKLLIYAGTHSFVIENLRDEELQWIGEELCQFLKLKLQTKYAMPKVPDPINNSCASGGC
jgi:hypothetical protein